MIFEGGIFNTAKKTLLDRFMNGVKTMLEAVFDYIQLIMKLVAS